jgi:hypothetical protein
MKHFFLYAYLLLLPMRHIIWWSIIQRRHFIMSASMNDL